MLTPLHVQDFCNGGQGGERCKYLTGETVGSKYVQMCMKHAPKIQEKHKKQQGGYYWGSPPKGDNCKGYLYLKHVPQGYDV